MTITAIQGIALRTSLCFYPINNCCIYDENGYWWLCRKELVFYRSIWISKISIVGFIATTAHGSGVGRKILRLSTQN